MLVKSDLSRNRQIQTMKDLLMKLLRLPVPSSRARDRAEQDQDGGEALQDLVVEAQLALSQDSEVAPSTDTVHGGKDSEQA